MNAHLKNYLFLSIPFICFAIGYVFCNIFVGNKSYPTPNLVGISLHEAILQTSPYHINIQVAAQKECPGVTHGTIISQKPTPGRQIKPHQSIIVVTCKLPEAQLTPNLIGKIEAQAQEICTNARIKLKTYPQNYPLPTNTIIGQTPQKEQHLSEKKIIAYTATEHLTNYVMPNLINKSLEQVLEFLQKYKTNISVFFQNQKISKPYPSECKIIGQKPLPGSFVNLKNELILQLEVEKI
ncbi:PASTA domain-containing protein [Candidatus Babeliales bacterium]|nr:PASTA domain-containing protein [Candidatus Babeliales bacterium]